MELTVKDVTKIYGTQTSHTENQPKARNIGKKRQSNITQPEQYAKNYANRQVNVRQSSRAMN